jgi:hypothetical protein
VTVIAKSLAGLAGPYPAVLEPGQTSLVKRDSPAGRVARAKDLFVTTDEPDEEHHRGQQPPAADRRAPREKRQENR